MPEPPEPTEPPEDRTAASSLATRVGRGGGEPVGRDGLRAAGWDSLAEAAARYQRIAEHAADGVYETDADGRVVWASPSLETLTGRTPAQLIGTKIVDLVLAEDRPAVLAARAELFAGGPTARIDTRIRAADGTVRWVATRADLIRDPVGTVTGLVVAFRDIDAEVTARHALVRAERRYHALAENGADMVTEAHDGSLAWCSDSVTAVLGWTPDELVGHPVLELLHPDDAAVLAPVMDRTLDATEEFVFRIRTRAGTYRWVAARVRDTVDPDGTPVRVSAWRDVDDAMHALAELLASQRQLRATLDSMLDPHVSLTAVRDAAGAIVDFVHTDVNEAACAYTGLTRDEFIGTHPLATLPAHASTGLLALYAAVVDTGVPLVLDDFVYPHELLAEPRHLDIRAVKVGDGLSLTWRDVTERQAELARIAAAATTDPLTGLANRAALLAELTRAMAAAQRSGQPVTILMVDLDHFKDINDTLGHTAGDELLVHAASRLTDCVRAGDLLARVGGDEFVVVLRDTGEPEVPLHAAARINAAFRQPFINGGGNLYTTASIGIAVATPDTTPAELLRDADTAMYRAKAEGRDRAALFNEELRVAVTERMELEVGLRAALERAELAVWFQPECDLVTRDVVAFEALLRWQRPSHDGTVEWYPADRFIAAAEATGLILPIGAWALDEACRLAAAWASTDGRDGRDGRDGHDGTAPTVRVNLSAHQLADAGLADRIDATVAAHGLAPSRLCFEITETVLLEDSATVHANLLALHASGYRLAVDDFGTGYASLAYLRDHPIDVVKIDRSFVASMQAEPMSRKLVSGVVALAEHLGLGVVAEGVEEEEQVRWLLGFGCRRGQGFLFSPAVPPGSVPALLAGRRVR